MQDKHFWAFFAVEHLERPLLKTTWSLSSNRTGKLPLNLMRLESLLLSRDPEVIRVLQPVLEKLSIDVEVCHGVGSGQEILRTEKFDAVIVDCDDLKGGLDVLASLRKSASDKNSVTFLNGSTTTQQAFQMGLCPAETASARRRNCSTTTSPFCDALSAARYSARCRHALASFNKATGLNRRCTPAGMLALRLCRLTS